MTLREFSMQKPLFLLDKNQYAIMKGFGISLIDPVEGVLNFFPFLCIYAVYVLALNDGKPDR